MADPDFRPLLHTEERYKFDLRTHAVTVIQEQHRLLHDGFYFQTSGKQTAWLDATEKKFLLRTPILTFPHIQLMKLNFGKGDIDFVAYEDATVAVDGTPLPVVNPNRNSAETEALLLFGEPTITDNGTQIFELWVPPTATGVGQSANGIEGVGQASEWILKPSCDYLVVLTNNSGTTISFSYEFAWYEIGYEATI